MLERVKAAKRKAKQAKSRLGAHFWMELRSLYTVVDSSLGALQVIDKDELVPEELVKALEHASTANVGSRILGAEWFCICGSLCSHLICHVVLLCVGICCSCTWLASGGSHAFLCSCCYHMGLLFLHMACIWQFPCPCSCHFRFFFAF